MKKYIIHNIAVWMAVLLLPVFVACSGPEDSMAPEPMEAGLYLNIAAIGQSRAGLETLLDNEKMKSLRVIVLHEDGKVEHNRIYSLSDSEQETKKILLKVTPNEKKKIFLFANEESVSNVKFEGQTETDQTELSLTSFFEQYAEAAENFADDVSDLYFAPDYSEGKAIPMSSMYEIEMGKGTLDKTLYLVRIASKFTVNFKNFRDEEVMIKNFSISSHADNNFMMARVNSFPNPDQYPSWIDWLKKVSEASSENDIEAAGWLKDYELPSLADKTKTYTHNTPITIAALNESTPGTESTVFYLPESQNIKTGATDREQEYTMTFKIDGKTESDSFTLPNLKALFRNTHVVINITLGKNNDILSLNVEIKPWENKKLVLDYTETVSTNGAIEWDGYDDYDESEGILVLKPWAEDIGYKVWVPMNGDFKINSPIGTTWTASLIPIEGDPVFRFLVKSEQFGGLEFPEYTVSGVVGDATTISIISLEEEPEHTNKAKLQIIVTLANGTVLRVPNGFDEYTIVQNPL